MMLSLMLAKIMGLVLSLVSLTLLVNKKNIDLLFRIYKNPGVVLFTGFIDFIVGLTIVLVHNIWSRDFRILITLIGWMLLIRGTGRILFPSLVTTKLHRMKKLKTVFVPLLVLILLIGIYLTFMGFSV